MKRIFIIFVCYLLGTSLIKGQSVFNEKSIKSFEFETSLGTTYGLDKYVGDKCFGPAFALEGRYNFKKRPLDLGLEIYCGSTLRNYDGEDQSCRIASIMIFSDYNFNRGKRISPFAGLGVGVASCDVVVGSYGDEGGRYIISPRVGIEFLRHIRLTCYSRLCMKAYNNIGLSIGYAFGGGLKNDIIPV